MAVAPIHAEASGDKYMFFRRVLFSDLSKVCYSAFVIAIGAFTSTLAPDAHAQDRSARERLRCEQVLLPNQAGLGRWVREHSIHPGLRLRLFFLRIRDGV